MIVALESGGVGPQLKISTCPEKFGITTPTGKLIVRTSVAVAVPASQRPAGLVALMVTGNVPTAVGVPEISPVVVSTVKPWGSPVAS